MPIDRAHPLDFDLARDLSAAPALETLAYAMCRFTNGPRQFGLTQNGCDCLRAGRAPCEVALVNARPLLDELKRKSA